MKKIFYWSPYIGKIATVKAVLNSAISIKKFSNFQNEVSIINCFGEWNLYKKRKVNEVTYCKKFFKDYKFSEAEIRAIIDYKDAYALREIVTYLLYKPNYVISGFDYKKVFKR